MKKIIVALLIFGFIGYAGLFYWRNFRGAGTAFGPSPKDITKFFEHSPASSENKPVQGSINTTGFPLRLPQGFSITIFAKNLGNARVLAWDPNGTLLVSVTSQGEVIAMPDKNGDGSADALAVVISGLNQPHGLAFWDGKLYIAETDQVASYDYDVVTYKVSHKKKLLDLPGGGTHFSRTIGFGPDKKLYVALGSTCNVCVEQDFRRAKIFIANPDGSDLKEYASGLRNSVFFTWNPKTQDIWATEMGRDLLGDDLPPDEINIIKEGVFYGWPYCYGQKIWDTHFNRSDNAKQKCENSESSLIDLQAHSAPLGLAFIPDSWPKDYRNNLLVSFHGSWNRSVPTGYKVVRVKLDEKGNYLGIEDFITGLLTPNGALGRPVDLLFNNKGSLFISDDKAGVIYRVISEENK